MDIYSKSLVLQYDELFKTFSKNTLFEVEY